MFSRVTCWIVIKNASNFLIDGTWKVTESEVNTANLPQEVTKTIASDFPGFTVKKGEKIESKELNGYEIQLVKGKTKKEVVFDFNGKIISQKKK